MKTIEGSLHLDSFRNARLDIRTEMSDTLSMIRIRPKIEEARSKKTAFPSVFAAQRGWRSHGTLFYGSHFTVVRNPKDDLKNGTLHAMLDQLGLSINDLQEEAMQGFIYPAVLTPDDEDGGFVVTFIDLPEAITQGEDVDDALEEATNCLDEAMANRIVTGMPIPKPSRIGKGYYAISLPAQTAAKAALYVALREANISKTELARRLQCDEKEVRRLLDPRHPSKLPRIESAMAAVGHKLVVGFQADA